MILTKYKKRVKQLYELEDAKMNFSSAHVYIIQLYC